MILPELDDVSAPTIVAEKILMEIAKPFNLEAGSVNISCSIGIALFPEDAASHSELLRKADAAMYESIVAGRGTFTYVKNLGDME